MISGKPLRPILEPQHARRPRILDLEPSLAVAGSIRVVAALRDDAFQPHLAGVRKDSCAVAFEVLIELNPGRCVRQQFLEPGLALLEEAKAAFRADYEAWKGRDTGSAG